MTAREMLTAVLRSPGLEGQPWGVKVTLGHLFDRASLGRPLSRVEVDVVEAAFVQLAMPAANEQDLRRRQAASRADAIVKGAFARAQGEKKRRARERLAARAERRLREAASGDRSGWVQLPDGTLAYMEILYASPAPPRPRDPEQLRNFCSCGAPTACTDAATHACRLNLTWFRNWRFRRPLPEAPAGPKELGR